MTDYESDKARYWRNCDVWTLSEVKFLLCGKWPVKGEAAPTTLPICLIDTPQDIYHYIEEDGKTHLLIEHKTNTELLNPVPDGTHLKELISRAIAAGTLTPLPRSTGTHEITTSQDLLKPREVIAWANARGCFPDFPFKNEAPAGAAGQEAAQAIAFTERETIATCEPQPFAQLIRTQPRSDEELAEMKEYRARYGTKKTAAHYGISEARIRQLLPSELPNKSGYSVFVGLTK